MVGRWGHPRNLLCALTASAHKPSVKTSTGDAGQLSAQVCGVGLYYELWVAPSDFHGLGGSAEKWQARLRNWPAVACSRKSKQLRS